MDLPEGYGDAALIFSLCRGQVIVAGMGDIIDINIQAVCSVMDIYGISDKRDCLEKVIRIFRIWQKNRKKNGQS